jgi:hypothetical protein
MCEPWEAYAKWHKPVTKKKEKKKKTNTAWFYLYEAPRVKTIETENRSIVAGSGKRGEWRVFFFFSFLFLRWASHCVVQAGLELLTLLSHICNIC